MGKIDNKSFKKNIKNKSKEKLQLAKNMKLNVGLNNLKRKEVFPVYKRIEMFIDHSKEFLFELILEEERIILDYLKNPSGSDYSVSEGNLEKKLDLIKENKRNDLNITKEITINNTKKSYFEKITKNIFNKKYDPDNSIYENEFSIEKLILDNKKITILKHNKLDRIFFSYMQTLGAILEMNHNLLTTYFDLELPKSLNKKQLIQKEILNINIELRDFFMKNLTNQNHIIKTIELLRATYYHNPPLFHIKFYILEENEIESKISLSLNKNEINKDLFDFYFKFLEHVIKSQNKLYQVLNLNERKNN